MEGVLKARGPVFISAWILAGVALGSLVATRELSAFTAACILTLFPLFLYFDLKGRLPKRPWLENALAVSLFLASGFRFFAWNESFLTVVADFLVAFLLLKCAGRKDAGDFREMTALSFFVFLSSATLALDFTFLFSFALFILAAGWALSLQCLEASGFPLHAGLPGDLSLRLRRNSGITLTLSLGFALAIFLFFPRLSLAVFQGALLGPVHKTGLSGVIALDKPGKVYRDSSVVLRVEADLAQARRVWDGRLRGQTLSYFDGVLWTPGEVKSRSVVKDVWKSRVFKARRLVPQNYRVLWVDADSLRSRLGMRLDGSSRFRQTIYLETDDPPLLFGAPWIESLTVKQPQIELRGDGSVLRPPDSKGRIRYEVVSLIEKPSESAVARAASRSAPLQSDSKAGAFPSPDLADPSEIQRNLQVPESSGGPALDLDKIRRLAAKIVSRRDSSYSKAKKIEGYLRKNYGYTLDLKGNPGVHPLEDFLFSSQKGHCEYFASAMALMLRLQGVPARIATGFLLDEKRPENGYFVARAQDAHAWIEAWIGGNWIEFDPTPREPSPAGGQSGVWKRIREKTEHLNFLWNAHVLGYDLETQQKFARKIELKSSQLSRSMDRIFSKLKRSDPDLETADPVTRGSTGRRSDQFIKTGLFFILIILFPALFYSLAKRTKKVSLNAGFYQQALRILSKKGWAKGEGETAAEFAQRLCRLQAWSRGSGEQAILRLTEIYYSKRFGGHSDPIAEVRSCLKSLSSNLRDSPD